MVIIHPQGATHVSSRTVEYTRRSLSKRGLNRQHLSSAGVGQAVLSHFRFQTYECDEMVNLMCQLETQILCQMLLGVSIRVFLDEMSI